MKKKQDFFEDKRLPFTMRIKLIRRINALEIENNVLKENIKDELYKEFMNKLGEPMEMKRLKSDNKRLRLKIKELKEIIKEGC